VTSGPIIIVNVIFKRGPTLFVAGDYSDVCLQHVALL